MADVTVTADDVRAVAHDPEDTLTLDAASGYTPSNGDLVALSGHDEVDQADADDGTGLQDPLGVVIDSKEKPRGGGYRVTVLLRGLLEGFSSLTAQGRLYNSTTAGAISDTDPSTTGVTGYVIGKVVTATAAYIDAGLSS